MNAGKLIIVGIFGVSLALGVFAWWYRYEQGNESLAFWGTEHAVRISDAATVQLLMLADEPSLPLDEPGDADQDEPDHDGPVQPLEFIEIGDRRWNVTERRDISRAGGFSHARLTLVRDVSFRWDEPRGTCAEAWHHALRFTDATGGTSLVAFDFACQRVRLVGTEREAALRSDLSDNLRDWFERTESPR